MKKRNKIARDLFTPKYKKRVVRPKKGKGRGNKNGDKPHNQPSNNKNSLERQLTEELETRLVQRFEDNRYCRKGFFELNRTFNRTIYTIHGECSESATPADRKNFINKTAR